jgi:taurine dioxygenase
MNVAAHNAIQSAGLSITPLARTIGAEITGIDLRQLLTAELKQALYQIMVDWKVIFFRDQDITSEQHMMFAREFGELEVHPFAAKQSGPPEVLQIAHTAETPGHENLWHSDVTWRLQPSLGSVLLCRHSPEKGGDTLFSDMYAAYEGLTDEVKELIEGKVARHDFLGFRRRMKARGVSDEKIAEMQEKYPNPHHPVVRTHPDTGRRALYVNAAFTREIVDMDPGTSARLLEHLYAQAATPEYQCRFQWQTNSIAFWDNRACQHYAVSDYWPDERKMERATIIGDTPFYDPKSGDPTSFEFKGILELRRTGGFQRFD